MYFDMKASGERIKKLRKSYGMTQEQLADELNISEGYLGKIELGVYGGSLDLLVVMSDYFDVSLDYLVLGKKSNNEELKIRIQGLITQLNAMKSLL